MSDTADRPDDDEGTELLQAWLVGEETLHCTIGMVSADPEFWSQILADLARHIAGAIADEKGANPEEMLQAIRNGFAKDLSEPAEGDA